MPIMDGFEATERIQRLINDNRIEDVPIIALTANAMKGDREKCLEVGMIDYVTKPVRKIELAKVIAKYIEPKNRSKVGNEDFEGIEILNHDIFDNYREVMQEKFVFGVENFLHDTRLLINRIEEGIFKKEIKTVHMSAHSLKSSSAALGAMELSSLSEFLEEITHEMLDHKKDLHGFEVEMAQDMEEAFKRVAPILDQQIKSSKNT